MKCIKRLLRKVWQIRLPHFANRFYFCALLKGIIWDWEVIQSALVTAWLKCCVRKWVSAHTPPPLGRLGDSTWLLQPLSHLTILSQIDNLFSLLLFYHHHQHHHLLLLLLLLCSSQISCNSIWAPPVYHNNPFMDHKRLKKYSALNSIMENKDWGGKRIKSRVQTSCSQRFYEDIIGHPGEFYAPL